MPGRWGKPIGPVVTRKFRDRPSSFIFLLHYIFYIIIIIYNPSSFNCLIDSMFIHIYSSYTFLLNQSRQYQLQHKPIPNWKGVWTYPQTLIVHVNMKEGTSPTKKRQNYHFTLIKGRRDSQDMVVYIS